MLRTGPPLPLLRNLTTTLLALTVVGVAAVPAHAESVRERQWHLDAMHAEQMWKTSQGEGITIAVIDTGVDPSLPDLKGQVLKGKDFSKEHPGDAHDDYDGHGTIMATVISATGGAGLEGGSLGVSPGSKILPVRVDNGYNEKNYAESIRNFGERIGPAIRYAANSKAGIINLSFANPGDSPELKKSVKYALSKGKIIFAGVGNHGDSANEILYPAASPGVIGVAGVDENSSATKESQHGRQVDLAAPGKDIVAACLRGNGICKTHGTSDATALASASAALVWAKHPDWTANQVTRVLVNTAEGPKNGDERNNSIGHGVVRPHVALKNPGDPGDPNTNPLPGPYNEKKDSRKSGSSDNDKQAAAGESSGPNWLGYGLAAAGVLAAGSATGLFVRHRRRATTPTHPTTPYGPPPPGPPPPPGR